MAIDDIDLETQEDWDGFSSPAPANQKIQSGDVNKLRDKVREIISETNANTEHRNTDHAPSDAPSGTQYAQEQSAQNSAINLNSEHRASAHADASLPSRAQYDTRQGEIDAELATERSERENADTSLIAQAADDATAKVNALETELRGVGADTETLKALRDAITDISAILQADDETLDTAQERIDAIKQLLSDVDTLAIVDVSGLQDALDDKVAQTTYNTKMTELDDSDQANAQAIVDRIPKTKIVEFFADCLTGNFTGFDRVETISHHSYSIGGGARYYADDTTGTASTGDEAKWFDSQGKGFVLKPDKITPEKFGAEPNNPAFDCTTAITAAIAFTHSLMPLPRGGGSVEFGPHDYYVQRPSILKGGVTLKGHWLSTFIRVASGSAFATDEAVLMTPDFPNMINSNVWSYYAPYPAGLEMGVGIDGIIVDGNRYNATGAGGIAIYGGKYHLNKVAVFSTDGHGIYTECGLATDSTSGDDLHDFLNMHESVCDVIYIADCNKHGWLYRGPNDSAIGDVQIKSCGWSGFHQESAGFNAVGNLEIHSLHAYACDVDHDADGSAVHLESANVKFLYTDASQKHGVRFANSASQAESIFVLGHNLSNSGEFFGVVCDVATQIGMIRNSEKLRTSGTNGGLFQNNADGTIIGQIRSSCVSGTTITENVIQLNAHATIGIANLEAYSTVGTSLVDINSSRCIVNLKAKNSALPVKYRAAGRNQITVNALGCSSMIDYQVAASSTDVITLIDEISGSITKLDKVLLRRHTVTVSNAAYSGTYTPNPAVNGSYVKGILNADTAIQPVVNKIAGDKLTLQFQQDATGGRVITFDSVYKTGFSNTGNASYKRCVVEFLYDGTFWVEQKNTGWF